MVGVGGRSKACDHCRRRRVKCDLAAPECARCIKAHLKCGGSRGLSFIQYNGSKAKQVRQTLGVSGISRAVLTAKEKTTTDSTFPQWNHVVSSQIAESFLMPGSMDDVYVSYALTYLLRENEEIVVKPGTSRALTNECFVALSTTIFGIDKEQPQVLQHGLHRYGTALQALNRALSDSKESQSFDVLEAVIVMAVFEPLRHQYGRDTTDPFSQPGTLF
ncbi:hypothetical protein CORC01_06103 [Colletotrichum orchidophilum]|uniref:Zn(2)-C6 fungal-type domain-containing protein n=1 Tax=Colletotrichum orchidophilum TaxID=1209926 RepID=A0A1G4BBH0_9PEZI|nr:uncharacterized protein CORC01_06103 [Colletotrichum orchidophilum]OHE98652.1 hypothetical protein CORC01_06103 [Colletotrichum orchidophilum]